MMNVAALNQLCSKAQTPFPLQKGVPEGRGIFKLDSKEPDCKAKVPIRKTVVPESNVKADI
jgi:hypothetical protein